MNRLGRDLAARHSSLEHRYPLGLHWLSDAGLEFGDKRRIVSGLADEFAEDDL
jgi:hypothetical protein